MFGRRCALSKQERPVDPLDVDPAVLHALDGVGDLQQLAGGFLGIGPLPLVSISGRSPPAQGTIPPTSLVIGGKLRRVG